MEIRLAQTFGENQSENMRTHFGDFLSEKEFAEIQSSVAVLQELHNVRYLLGFVEGNEKDMLDYFQTKTEEWVLKLRQHIYLDFAEINDCLLHTNRLFLNYLSSMRTFIDHSETYLNRTFGGRDSPELIEFKNMTSVLYDASFGYSFFWVLRNYAQHCGLPVGHVGFNWEAEEMQAGVKSVNYEFEVAFDSKNLLNNYKDWKKHIREALEQKDKNFPLLPLVFEVTSVIRTFASNLEVILHERLVEAAKLLDRYIFKIKEESGRVFVAYNIITDDRGKLENYSSVDLMEDTVKEILSANSRE